EELFRRVLRAVVHVDDLEGAREGEERLHEALVEEGEVRRLVQERDHEREVGHRGGIGHGAHHLPWRASWKRLGSSVRKWTISRAARSCPEGDQWRSRARWRRARSSSGKRKKRGARSRQRGPLFRQSSAMR